MRKIIRRAFIWVLILALSLSLVPLSLSDEAREETRDIQVTFLDENAQYVSWDFPFSDSLFFTDPNTFNLQTARMSFGFLCSGMRDNKHGITPEHQADRIRKFLADTGFTDVDIQGYDQPTDIDTVSSAIGMKDVGDVRIIAATTCCAGYQNEWMANFWVGDGERHAGFSYAAGILENRLEAYLESHPTDKKLVLWTTGFSRAAAISNIFAADMQDSGRFERIYAYQYACPRTVIDPKPRKGIFNIIGRFDAVPQVPLISWNYKRYGTDLFIRSRETNSDYQNIVSRNLDDVTYRLTGQFYRDNPYANERLHDILISLYKIVPTPKEYTELLQDTFIAAFKLKSIDDIEDAIAVIIETLTGIQAKSAKDAENVGILINALANLGVTIIRGGGDEAVQRGYWDETASFASNVMMEHSPCKYLEWIFSSDDPKEIFTDDTSYTRLVINGETEVMLVGDEGLIATIGEDDSIVYDADNTVTVDEDQIRNGSVTEDGSKPFIKAEGTQTVLVLPCDQTFYVLTSAKKGTDVVCYVQEGNKDTTWYGNETVYIPQMDEDGLSIITIRERNPFQDAKIFFWNASEVKVDAVENLIRDIDQANKLDLDVSTLIGFAALTFALLLLLLLISVISLVYRLIRHKYISIANKVLTTVLVVLVGFLFYILISYFMSSRKGLIAGLIIGTVVLLVMLLLYIPGIRRMIRRKKEEKAGESGNA